MALFLDEKAKVDEWETVVFVACDRMGVWLVTRLQAGLLQGDLRLVSNSREASQQSQQIEMEMDEEGGTEVIIMSGIWFPTFLSADIGEPSACDVKWSTKPSAAPPTERRPNVNISVYP